MNQRQKKFFELMESNSCAIFFSKKISCSNARGWPGIFIQESNFWYLLPISEDQSALILFKDEENCEHTFLFCAPKDPYVEQWQGSRYGPKAYQDLYPTAIVDDIAQLDVVFKKLLQKIQLIYYGWSIIPERDAWLIAQLKMEQARLNFGIAVKDWRPFLQKLRNIKSVEEIECLKKSAAITAHAFRHISEQLMHYQYEFEIQSDLYSVFGKYGASPAYPAIVASGINGLCLHYSKNQDALTDCQSILVDAGSEYKGYASDVTRTFFRGIPSKPWQQLYQLVKKVQQSVIKIIKPGISFIQLENMACKLLAQGLIELKLLKSHIKDISILDELRTFYPHKIGHWIGLDVHDLGPQSHRCQTIFVPGMVLTVEPGLYIPQSSEYAPFSGISIRIEDVIHVTLEGCCNLTESILK